MNLINLFLNFVLIIAPFVVYGEGEGIKNKEGSTKATATVIPTTEIIPSQTTPNKSEIIQNKPKSPSKNETQGKGWNSSTISIRHMWMPHQIKQLIWVGLDVHKCDESCRRLCISTQTASINSSYKDDLGMTMNQSKRMTNCIDECGCSLAQDVLLMLTFNNSLYMSENGGLNWSSENHKLEEAMRTGFKPNIGKSRIHFQDLTIFKLFKHPIFHEYIWMITSAGKVLLSKTGGLNYTLCPPFLNNNRESLNARNIVMNSIDVFSVLVVATDPQCQILSNCQKYIFSTDDAGESFEMLSSTGLVFGYTLKLMDHSWMAYYFDFTYNTRNYSDIKKHKMTRYHNSIWILEREKQSYKGYTNKKASDNHLKIFWGYSKSKKNEVIRSGKIRGIQLTSRFIFLLEGQNKIMCKLRYVDEFSGIEFLDENQLPYNLPDIIYLMLVSELETGGVLMGLKEDPSSPYANLFRADFSGKRMYLSIRNIRITKSNELDILQIPHLDSFILGNKVVREEESGIIYYQTMVTRDQGISWGLLNVSEELLERECGSGSMNPKSPNPCTLNLLLDSEIGNKNSESDSESERDFRWNKHNELTFSPLESIGIIIGTGIVAPHFLHPGAERYREDLKAFNSYISTDGGLTWGYIRKGNVGAGRYVLGKEGGYLGRSLLEGAHDIDLSFDMGSTWESISLWNMLSDLPLCLGEEAHSHVGDHPLTHNIYIEGLIAHPSQSGSVIHVLGTLDLPCPTPYVFTTLDISSHVPYCTEKENLDSEGGMTEGDFEVFEPTVCVNGERRGYRRRKGNRKCIIRERKWWGVREQYKHPCLCTPTDFECDHGYIQDREGVCLPLTLGAHNQGSSHVLSTTSDASDPRAVFRGLTDVGLRGNREDLELHAALLFCEEIGADKENMNVSQVAITKGYVKRLGVKCVGGADHPLEYYQCTAHSTFKILLIIGGFIFLGCVCLAIYHWKVKRKLGLGGNEHIVGNITNSNKKRDHDIIIDDEVMQIINKYHDSSE